MREARRGSGRERFGHGRLVRGTRPCQGHVVVLLGLIRRAVTLSQARRMADAYGTRVVRESKTLKVAAEVWSDVAASRGLGFRTSDAGPLLHGELPSGVAFEMGVYAREDEGDYATLATIKLGAALPGRVVARTHEPWTRALQKVLGTPPGLDDATERLFVRAKPRDLAARILTPTMRELLAHLADRNPALHASGDEVALVLDGVELAHERIEAILDGLDALGRPGALGRA